MCEALMKEVTNKDEVDDLTTLFMNHRLKMAKDLDLFDELERVLDEETELIEKKSENMLSMSMMLRKQAKVTPKKEEMNHNETLVQDFFEGFAERSTGKSAISGVSTNAGNNVTKSIANNLAPNFAPNSF